MRVQIALATAAILIAATPAFAVTNLITNGSFEAANTTGSGAFTGWTKSGTVGDTAPASVIAYNSGAQYPDGAFGEAVGPDNSVSQSPDAVGNYGAYFVGDLSVNETISQQRWLTPGNYRLGFSYYLTQNGLGNVNNASLMGTILGSTVASTVINNASLGQTWLAVSGVGQITLAGFYTTNFVYNSNGAPAKDIVIDRVYAISTLDAATVVIPETTVFAVPEPATWTMLVLGFGMVGFGLRRRRPAAIAA